MEIVKHVLCTKVLAPPPEMPEPDCSPLPVMETTDEFGTWSTSFWRPSKEEIEALAKGGLIALQIKAQDDMHPVVGLAVLENPTVANDSPGSFEQFATRLDTD